MVMVHKAQVGLPTGSYYRRVISSPVGLLTLVTDGTSLVGIHWGDDFSESSTDKMPEACQVLDSAALQLDEYFASRRHVFDLPLAFHGTPFQQRVWNALREIPFGKIRSYREMAEAIGRPTATQAVGAAIGRNPLAIVVPCHRVLGADGSLTGFAGGLAAKGFLLKLEGILV